MGAVAVKNTSTNKSMSNRLFNDRVEDSLFYIGTRKTTTAILRQRRGIGDFIGQS